MISLLLGAGLLGLALRTEERRRTAPSLPPLSADLPNLPTTAVTVLLPVRDEEVNVLPCLDTLLAQTAKPRVRVIDDASTDATAALVAERAAGEPRLELVPAGPLPEGWRGKVHALWTGSRGVETPWVLSTDADTRHDSGLLARSLAAAREGNLDAVSIAGFQEAVGVGENLLTPAVFAFLDALLGDWRAAASGEGPVVANGQFILLRREAWASCGGFESVRSEVIDDLAVVNRLRSRGFRTAFFRDAGLRVRMYRGWREVSAGWRRNLGGLFGADLRLAAGTLAVLLAPPLALLGLALAGRPVEAVLLWSAGAAASMILRSGSGHRPAWGLLYPLDALALAWVLALGVSDRRRGRLARWKGRELKI